MRDVRPDLIITHSTGDYMSDHNETSKLVFDCSFHATLPLLESGRAAPRHVTPIYFMDTVMGLGFEPTEYVDVTTTIETKVAMLEAHESQLTWLRDHDGIDIVEQMRAVTRFRGLQCGVQYAEGFSALPDLAPGDHPAPSSLTKGLHSGSRPRLRVRPRPLHRLPRRESNATACAASPAPSSPNTRIRTSGSPSSTTRREFYRSFAG